MKITIDIKPQDHIWLFAEAVKEKKTVEEYCRDIIECFILSNQISLEEENE